MREGCTDSVFCLWAAANGLCHCLLCFSASHRQMCSFIYKTSDHELISCNPHVAISQLPTYGIEGGFYYFPLYHINIKTFFNTFVLNVKISYYSWNSYLVNQLK